MRIFVLTDISEHADGQRRCETMSTATILSRPRMALPSLPCLNPSTPTPPQFAVGPSQAVRRWP